MTSLRPIFVSFLLILLTGSLCFGQNLSNYRDFQLGTNVESVVKQVGMKRSDVRVVHVRPALIEELDWNPRLSGSRPEIAESLREIRFTFYRDELFKMVVAYDPRETEGLTIDDVTEAISVRYGKMSVPADVAVVVSADSSPFPDSEKVIALWQDLQYSYSLYRSTYSGSFGLVIISNEGALKASAAGKESVRLDQLEAPQRELARQKKEESVRREAQETTRTTNKVKFRP